MKDVIVAESDDKTALLMITTMHAWDHGWYKLIYCIAKWAFLIKLLKH